MRCPCGKKSEVRTYAECCRPYHAGLRAPATAEALMRSRYSAFAMKDSNYIHATWHRTTRPPRITFVTGEAWLALRVLATSTDADSATVEFMARSLVDGQSKTLHEVSRFVREDGRWSYVDGVIN